MLFSSCKTLGHLHKTSPVFAPTIEYRAYMIPGTGQLLAAFYPLRILTRLDASHTAFQLARVSSFRG